MLFEEAPAGDRAEGRADRVFDPRTIRMLNEAVRIAEGGGRVKVWLELSGVFDRLGTIKRGLLGRESWFAHGRLFLHRSGGSIEVDSAVRDLEDWRNRFRTPDLFEFLDPVAIEEALGCILERLHQWDQPAGPLTQAG